MPTEKEKIYDEQIHPLMSQVIEICRKNRIAFIFDAALGCESEGDNRQLKCTSCLLDEDCDPPEVFIEAYELIRPRSPQVFTFMITKAQ